MAIPVECPCGKSLRIKPEFAGKRVKCPQCKTILTIPTEKIEADFEVLEQEADEAPVDVSPSTAIVAKHVSRPPVEDRESDRPPPPRPPRPRKKRRRRCSERSSGSSFSIPRASSWGL